MNRPGAAVAFAIDAIDAYGEPVEDSCDHVLIPVSQQHLARRNRCAPSTVSWYLRRLGSAVVERRGGIVIDRRALAEMSDSAIPISPRAAVVERELLDSFARPSADGAHVELVAGDNRPATLGDVARQLGINRSSAHRHLSNLERAGRLRREGRRLYAVPSPEEPPLEDQPQPPPPAPARLVSPEQVLQLLDKVTDLLAVVTSLAAQLLGTQPASGGAHDPRLCGAQTAAGDGLRAAPVAAQGRGFPSDVDLIDRIDDEITSNQSPQRAADSREPTQLRAEDSRIGQEPDWTVGDLPELLRPLLDECERQQLPGVTDPQRVADSLRPYRAEQITTAARQMTADLRGGAPMRSPIAILVRKADDADPYYFRAAPPATAKLPPPTSHTVVEPEEPVDEEAVAAVAALGPGAALDELDEAVAAHLRSLLGERTSALDSPQALAYWRPIVWRMRQRPPEGA